MTSPLEALRAKYGTSNVTQRLATQSDINRQLVTRVTGNPNSGSILSRVSQGAKGLGGRAQSIGTQAQTAVTQNGLFQWASSPIGNSATASNAVSASIKGVSRGVPIAATVVQTIREIDDVNQGIKEGRGWTEGARSTMKVGGATAGTVAGVALAGWAITNFWNPTGWVAGTAALVITAATAIAGGSMGVAATDAASGALAKATTGSARNDGIHDQTGEIIDAELAQRVNPQGYQEALQLQSASLQAPQTILPGTDPVAGLSGAASNHYSDPLGYDPLFFDPTWSMV